MSIAAGDRAKSANPATDALEAAKAAAHAHQAQEGVPAPGPMAAAE